MLNARRAFWTATVSFVLVTGLFIGLGGYGKNVKLPAFLAAKLPTISLSKIENSIGLKPAAPADPIEALKQKVVAGDSDAAFELGIKYRHGDGVKKDPVQAYAYLLVAAAADNAAAKDELRRLFSSMTFVQVFQAEKWALELVQGGK